MFSFVNSVRNGREVSKKRKNQKKIERQEKKTEKVNQGETTGSGRKSSIYHSKERGSLSHLYGGTSQSSERLKRGRATIGISLSKVWRLTREGGSNYKRRGHALSPNGRTGIFGYGGGGSRSHGRVGGEAGRGESKN